MLQRDLLRLCVGLSVLELTLVAAFRIAFGSQELDFLVWNLSLAWIPLIAALALDDVRSTPLALNLPLLAFWLAFFPNAPYLVTDLIHANDFSLSPAGAIAVVALIAAVPAGLVLGFSSLLLVERSMRERFGPRVALGISVTSLAAACVGIYLGRVLRLNSWDLLSRPRLVAAILHQHLLDPRPLAGAATVALGMVLAALYLRFRRTLAAAREER